MENSLLERGLRQAHKEHFEEAQKGVDELKLLIDSDGQRDLEMLRKLAPDSPLIANEHKLGKLIELEKFEKEYDGKVYTRAMIKQLAIEYKLKFLSSRYFSGHMDVEVLSKIKEFAKNTNTEIDPHTLSSRFFILAPVECFHLNQRERPKPVPVDPLIFYMIGDNHYRLIHKWGSDFSPLRRILGWKWESMSNVRHFNFFVHLPIFALLGSMFYDPTTLMQHWQSFIVMVMTGSYLLAIFRNAELQKREKVFTPDQDFFTKNNWDVAEHDKTTFC